MKKFIMFLVAMLIVMPASVSAIRLELIVPDETPPKDDCEGESYCSYSIDSWILADEKLSLAKGTEIKVTFTTSDAAIKLDGVIPATGLAELSSTSDSVTFVVTGDSYDLVANSNVEFATFMFGFDNTGTIPDCSIEFEIPSFTSEDPEEEKDTTTNPETGNFVPLVGLSGVAVAGAGVYFMSRKKSKMFNI